MTILLYGGLAALAVGILVAATTAFSPRPAVTGVARSLQSIEDAYAARRSALTEVRRFAAMPGWLRTVAVRLSPSGIGAKVQHRLDLAGNPSVWTPDRLLAVKGLGLFGAGVLGALYGLVFGGVWAFVLGSVGAAFGFFLPDLLLYNAGLKRQEKIGRALPDALDMLTVCVEAGLGFDSGLAQVARNTSGPLAAEFARALQEMQIGKSRTSALRGMAERTTVAELRTFISALVQAGELGIPMAKVLREQAKEQRIKRRQRAEEKAQKVPVKILFPLIFCIFPVLFIVVIGPGAIQIAHSLFSH